MRRGYQNDLSKVKSGFVIFFFFFNGRTGFRQRPEQINNCRCLSAILRIAPKLAAAAARKIGCGRCGGWDKRGKQPKR